MGNLRVLSVLSKLIRQAQPGRMKGVRGGGGRLTQRKVCERCEWTWWCSGKRSAWWLEECTAAPRLCLMAQFTGSVAVCGLTLLQLPLTQSQSQRNPLSWTHCCCSRIYSPYLLPLRPLHPRPHSEKIKLIFFFLYNFSSQLYAEQTSTYKSTDVYIWLNLKCY